MPIAIADIKIGASLPLTGGFSFAGAKHEQDYQLWFDLINDHGGILVEQDGLVISDNRSSPATAINQYEQFINVDQVDVVYGLQRKIHCRAITNPQRQSLPETRASGNHRYKSNPLITGR